MENKPTIKVMFAGSIDDGKSTLIGRLLCAHKKVKDDILESIARDSKHYNGAPGAFNWALVADGLKSEREQGITIDVAHIYTETDNAYLHILDCPGHVEYTSNMAVAASMADVAVLLIDASRGPTEQTLRHLSIMRMLQVPWIILALNKCDLIGWDGAKAQEIVSTIDQWNTMLAGLSNEKATFRGVQLSATEGKGLEKLERFLDEAIQDIQEKQQSQQESPLLVINGGITFTGEKRLYRATALTDAPLLDQVWQNMRTGTTFRIKEALTQIDDPELPGKLNLPKNEYVISLDTEVDIQKGDVLAVPGKWGSSDSGIAARLYWLAKKEFCLGEKNYILKGIGSTEDNHCAIDSLEYVEEINDKTLVQYESSGVLKQYQTGAVHLSTESPLQIICPYGPYNRRLGNYLVIDPDTNETVGFTMIAGEN